ncbi:MULTISPECIES: DUF1292 domain-containing protein [Mammaliicoccus]|uniref:UPF0473 protein BU072_04080 n=1 Tax=Mammaliicoccus vitulinus TaxID=71237 RepID=A0A2T4PV82_9STAP|nr:MULTISPECIES: DUF1292 domain-containing protein [Mammaliicoccus]MBM6628261.1 DUF1292 domain-containing protein [Mammaliicoccus vitulinus]MBO3077285.1 DUF1292 domain-containing protein [Mammaliicoccus vitulinus]MEB7656953.1 DUF1292 domain-containing protein [Mammaliicoccus vitulinus]PNZ36517.1 DUF1292 domain-containing protein [Mammaliicoccus vitulinus]PTI30338.1 DUF1292 domain-containing protein [Mammaliicoccus vitulinus]
MTEHNHEEHLDINNEEELLTLIDEDNNEVLYRKVLEFYHPEFKKEYIILAEEGTENEEEVELIPMINEANDDGEGGKLLPVETDEEWEMIEEIVNTEMDDV